MKVKVCGITEYVDAAAAVDQGVDALGFNFFRASPRYVRPETVRSIVRRLPPFVTLVGVFVNVPDPLQVEEIADCAGMQVIQLHGDESVEYCRRLEGRPLIKALRVGGPALETDIARYPVQAVLLDSRADNLYGGTGKAFDWTLTENIRGSLPIILAGGLRVDNVGEAIRRARPYGVDVCSGVESSPGRKSASLLAAFMEEVRNAP